MPVTYNFHLPEISCPSCVNIVMSALQSQTAFTLLNVQIDLDSQQLKITFEEDGLSEQEVLDWVENTTGFSCKPWSEIAAEMDVQAKINPRWFWGGAGVGIGLLWLIVPLIIGPLPWLAMIVLGLPSAALTIVLGLESFSKSGKMLSKGYLHMDTLFSISAITAIAISIAGLFVPGLPMMFDAGLLIFGFRHIGKAIREALERSMQLKAKFQDRAPKKAKRKNPITQEFEVVDVNDLNIGDIIEITEGMVIPVDGTVEIGTGLLDCSIEYGNKDFIRVEAGQPLSAGSILKEGAFTLRVSQRACDSLLARKDASIKKSMESSDQAIWKTKADRALNYFIPIVLGLALVSGVVTAFFFPMASVITCVTAILVSACPCTLGLIIGMIIHVGISKAADHGITFKSTRKLEEMDDITHVCFDLNGTLTTTEPQVIEAQACDGAIAETFYKYAALLEEHSNKSVGIAIYQYAKSKLSNQNTHPITLDHSNHSGVKAMIDNQQCMIGNAQFMRDHGVRLDGYLHRLLKTDETMMYVVCEKQILGHFILQRPLRPEAWRVVNALKNTGKTIHILTGSDQETANRYAKTLGIPLDRVHASLTSAGKVERINQLLKTGRVVMVGDEENDADALAASTIGIAMPVDGRSKRTNMNHDIAEAECKLDSLEPIVSGFEISHQTNSNIKWCLLFSWCYNLFALLLPPVLLFSTGMVLNPGIAAALMIVQTCMVMLQTFWFKHQGLEYLNAIGSNVNQEATSSYQSVNSTALFLQTGLGFKQNGSPKSLSQDTVLTKQNVPQIKLNVLRPFVESPPHNVVIPTQVARDLNI